MVFFFNRNMRELSIYLYYYQLKVFDFSSMNLRYDNWKP